MPRELCKVLLIEDDPAYSNLVRKFLLDSDRSSLGSGLAFEITRAENFAAAMELVEHSCFDVILLDLMLPDSQGMSSLIKIKQQAPQMPVVVQTSSEDESIIVQAFKLGAFGYIRKHNLDRNLLLYALRLAMERQQYIANLESIKQQQEQEQEFQVLEELAQSVGTKVTARMFGSEALQDSLPEIFQEMVTEYGYLMDLALEQRAYKIEHNIADRLRSLAEKLGFLKTGPRDIVAIHTKALKQRSANATVAKAQAYVTEGRLMVLELMGYLTSYYRKYYIGLSNINISANSYGLQPK